jgi:hypothetical protein
MTRPAARYEHCCRCMKRVPEGTPMHAVELTRGTTWICPTCWAKGEGKGDEREQSTA